MSCRHCPGRLRGGTGQGTLARHAGPSLARCSKGVACRSRSRSRIHNGVGIRGHCQQYEVGHCQAQGMQGCANRPSSCHPNLLCRSSASPITILASRLGNQLRHSWLKNWPIRQSAPASRRRRPAGGACSKRYRCPGWAAPTSSLSCCFCLIAAQSLQGAEREVSQPLSQLAH